MIDLLAQALDQRLDEVLWGWQSIAAAVGLSPNTARRYATDPVISDDERLPVKVWPGGTPMSTKRALLEWANRMALGGSGD